MRTSDRDQIWHACADRYDWLSPKKNCTHPNPGGLGGYLSVCVAMMMCDDVVLWLYSLDGTTSGLSLCGDSMSNQSLLALFRTTHLRFCSNFTCLFTSMIEATVPNFRKIGQVFLEIRPPKKLTFYPKNCA